MEKGDDSQRIQRLEEKTEQYIRVGRERKAQREAVLEESLGELGRVYGIRERLYDLCMELKKERDALLGTVRDLDKRHAYLCSAKHDLISDLGESRTKGETLEQELSGARQDAAQQKDAAEHFKTEYERLKFLYKTAQSTLAAAVEKNDELSREKTAFEALYGDKIEEIRRLADTLAALQNEVGPLRERADVLNYAQVKDVSVGDKTVGGPEGFGPDLAEQLSELFDKYADVWSGGDSFQEAIAEAAVVMDECGLSFEQYAEAIRRAVKSAVYLDVLMLARCAHNELKKGGK